MGVVFFRNCPGDGVPAADLVMLRMWGMPFSLAAASDTVTARLIALLGRHFATSRSVIALMVPLC